MEYQSPGAAFSSGVEEYLAKQAAQKHQTLLDNLAVQKAAHETDNERQDYELKKQELAERQREYEGDNRWKVEASKAAAAKEDKQTAAALAAEQSRQAAATGLEAQRAKAATDLETQRAAAAASLEAGKEKYKTAHPSTASTDAADARKSTQRENVYKTAVTELDKAEAPFASHVSSLNDLDAALAARTPEADTLIGPLVLKSTISGQGTGFRMTRAEIENVVGGRSKWQSLQAAAQKWATNPKDALSITEEQRSELRDLSAAIRKNTNAQLKKISTVRHKMNAADDPREIERLGTELQDEMSQEPEGASTPSGPKRIMYDMQGNPVKQ